MILACYILVCQHKLSLAMDLGLAPTTSGRVIHPDPIKLRQQVAEHPFSACKRAVNLLGAPKLLAVLRERVSDLLFSAGWRVSNLWAMLSSGVHRLFSEFSHSPASGQAAAIGSIIDGGKERLAAFVKACRWPERHKANTGSPASDECRMAGCLDG